VDIHVDVPVNKVVFLEHVRLVFDTGMILEDEFEGGRRTFRDKIDIYFYGNILSLLKNNDGLCTPFK
jgi:hypothetical protein